MRITFLLPAYGWHPSGGFRVVYTYAARLARRGCTVRIVHPRRLPEGGWPEPRSRLGRVRRIAAGVRDRIITPGPGWMSIPPEVAMLYVPEISPRHVPEADVVIATWWSTVEAALSLPASRGRPYHLVQGYEIWAGNEERVHAALRAAVHKICVSSHLRDTLLQLGVPAAATTVLPSGVDPSVFHLTRPVAHRPPRVAMLYSRAHVKGGDLGLEILRRAKARSPELTAAVFSGERKPQRLADWIRFHRRIRSEELAERVYNLSAVYLCPSRAEGWHLPNVEAMACGCVVVAPDIGGVRDYAFDGESALLYPPGDLDRAAELIASVLHDTHRREQIADRGLQVAGSLTWERSTERLLALLREGAGDRQTERAPTRSAGSA